ncbi:MAG TPA: hypothetical protein VGR57_04230, partial [Ktedonobacterales bacterium]|nr:hypothetical protein [Ktedonobacterales bacterium]
MPGGHAHGPSPVPGEVPAGAASAAGAAPLGDALATLGALGIAPLTRPRVLAAARAWGEPIELDGWYAAAWQLERDGRYRRRGEREIEWLEPASAADAPPAIPPARVLATLATELERIHDVAGLLALAQAATDARLAPVAEQAARAATRLDPKDVEASLTLARLLAARGELSAAAAEGRRAVRLAPEHVEAHVLLANC